MPNSACFRWRWPFLSVARVPDWDCQWKCWDLSFFFYGQCQWRGCLIGVIIVLCSGRDVFSTFVWSKGESHIQPTATAAAVGD